MAEHQTYGSRLPPKYSGEDGLPKMLALAGAKTLGLIVREVQMSKKQRRALIRAVAILEDLSK